jgi:hypothetical protein
MMLKGPSAPDLIQEHLKLPLDVFLIISSYLSADLFVGSLPIQSTCKAWAVMFKDKSKRPLLNSDTVTAHCKNSTDAIRVLSDPLKVKHLSVEHVLIIASLCEPLIYDIIEQNDILTAIARYPGLCLINYLGSHNLGFAKFLLSFSHRGLPINNGTLQICPVESFALTAQHASLALDMVNDPDNHAILTSTRLALFASKHCMVKARIQEIPSLRDKLNSFPAPIVPFPSSTTDCKYITERIHLLTLDLKNRKQTKAEEKRPGCQIS